jgi:hypothetical protein
MLQLNLSAINVAVAKRSTNPRQRGVLFYRLANRIGVPISQIVPSHP